MALQFEVRAQGAGKVIARSLELMAQVFICDEHGEDVPEEILEEARMMKAVVDEWLEWSDDGSDED